MPIILAVIGSLMIVISLKNNVSVCISLIIATRLKDYPQHLVDRRSFILWEHCQNR